MLFIKNSLFFLYLFISNTVFFERLQEMFTDHKWKSLVIFTAVWIISTFSLWLLSNHSRKKVRLIGFIFISLWTIFSFSYYKVSHHYLTFPDMELLWLAKAQAGQALSFYFGQSIEILTLSTIGFFAFYFRPMPLNKILKNNLIFWSFVFLPLPLLVGITYKKAGYGTEGMPHQFSALSTFVFYKSYDALYPSMAGKREAVMWKSAEIDKEQSKNIIYIVDESIRADYIDLNKDRQTTPFLIANKEHIANFGVMSSGNNCSGYSNIILRTGVSPNMLDQVGSSPLIWSYAKKAGYKTIYLDAQQKTGVLQNFMDQNELDLIDEFIQFESFEAHQKDEALAAKILEYQNKPGKYFLYVNKRGAHFPYNETFPENGARFKPFMKSGEALGENKERLINSYKNSILSGVDNFFKGFYSSLTKKESVIFYTADHGQNLMDSGIMTHCNTLNPHETEGQVPFFIMSSNQEKLNLFKIIAAKSRDKLTHFHIFGSLLQEMGYLKEDIESRFLLNLQGDTLIPRKFTTGGIIPRFGRATSWKEI